MLPSWCPTTSSSKAVLVFANRDFEVIIGRETGGQVIAQMHGAGLGVKKNAATAYAWVLVGQRLGTRDDDEAARNEIYEAAITMYSDLSMDERAEAYGLIEVMCGPSPASDTKGIGS